MDFLTYLAVLVATTLIQRALAPKIRTPMPALEDFQVPTAEYGRSIPWLFGTRKIKDPNIIWYGDLDRHGKTKDGAKYYTYYMGLHLEICIGPVDKVTAIDYGEKRAWTGEVTSSGQITISQPKLYGGRYKEGGIDGYFDLCFGESAQAVNSYLQAQLGTPLSAFRDSLTLVFHQGIISANSAFVRPIMPTVQSIYAGWPDGCWFPETAGIAPRVDYGDENPLHRAIMRHNPGLFARFDDPVDGSNNFLPTAANSGSGPDGTYHVAPRAVAGIVPDGARAASMYGNGAAAIHYPQHADYSYTTNNRITIACKLQLDDDFRAFDTHYLWHEGDHGLSGNHGLGAFFTIGDTDSLTVIYYAGDDFRSAQVAIPSGKLVGGAAVFVLLAISKMGGTSGQGYFSLHLGCEGARVGEASFPPYAIPGTTSTPAVKIGSVRGVFVDTFQIHATIDNFAIFPRSLSRRDIERLARAYCGGSALRLDMNPAHIVYRVWVDRHQGMAEDPANIDAVAMAYAADIFFDERTGLSMYWARQCAIEEFIGEVCRHAGALQTINPRTGQLKIVALRDDYDISSLDALTEDDVIEVVEWQDAADGEAVNTITVRWVDRDGAAQATTYTNRASVQQHGVIAETRDYPGIATEARARRVAKRDVKEASSNLSKGKIKVNRAGWDKFPGDVFIFSHAPEGIEEIVLRVLEIDTGTLTDGAITLTVVQDVFSLPLDVPEISEQGNEWTTPSTAPAEATTATLMELPYWALLDALGVAETGTLGDGAGYLAALAAKPTPLTTDIDIWARISPASYAEVRPEQVCAPSAMLASALDRATDTDIQLDDLSQIEDVEVDWLVQIGTGALAELCRVTAIDADAATVSVDRAILDTTPQTHDAATPLFFLPPSASDWALDPTQYADSDTVDVKLQTGTASGEIDISTVTAISATMASRQARPYPPGNLEINSEAYPTLLLGPLTVTWAERDRVVQGTTIISQDDATDYGPESGTTYNCYAYDDSDDTLLDSDTGISAATWSPVLYGSHMLRIEIEAERDGYVSWQRQVRTFIFVADRARIVVSGDPRETATGNIRDTTG
jgi:hypothetical protein